MNKGDYIIKARLRYDGTFWIGEIYGIWENLLGKRIGWKKVTDRCYTKVGAKLQLNSYVRKLPEEFEL